MNIKKVIKYVWKTDWNTIKSDCNKYFRLRNRCHKLLHQCGLRYDAVTKIVDPDDCQVTESCIKRRYFNVMNTGVSTYDNSTPGLPETLVSVETVCDNFSESSACTRTNCKCHDANNQLVRMTHAYECVVAARKNFWERKFDENAK